MLDVNETTTAAYVMLKFGGADKTLFDTGITLNGNIGVRYVQTKVESHGGVAFNNANWYTTLAPCNTPTGPNNLLNVSCYLTDAIRNFSGGPAIKSAYGATHENWLPSLNLKLLPKLKAELKPGTRIVSHAFNMGDWEPEQTINVEGRTVYMWTLR